MPRPVALRRLTLLFVLIDGVAVGFVLAILAGLGSGVALHEIAGLALLVLLLLAVATVLRSRPAELGLLGRILIALAALVLAGTLGALLAEGLVPAGYAGWPLAPLGVLVLTISDAVRVSRAGPPVAPPAAPPPR